MRRFLFLLLSVALAAGLAFSCDTDKPPPPPVAGPDASADPADADEGDVWQDPGLIRKDAGVAYPPGPYGTAEGDTAEEVLLYGYPLGDSTDSKNAYRQVRLSEFYDPQGTKGPNGGQLKLIWIILSSVWCGPCNAEAAGDPTATPPIPSLNERCLAVAPKGVACYTSLLEDADGNPAQKSDIINWKTNYKIGFAITHDPAVQWSKVCPPKSVPLNMFVDAKTMKIVKKCWGHDVACIDGALDLYSRCPTAVCPGGQTCGTDGVCQ